MKDADDVRVDRRGRKRRSVAEKLSIVREPDIGRPSARVAAVVADSVALARMILDRIVTKP
jgi:hypothetical protein